jgi:hypothetical protein
MKIHSFQFRSSVAKLLLLAGILFFYPRVTTAQTTIAIAPAKLNLLYIGLNNPISVAASGGVDDNVTVSIKGGGGTVSKVGAGLYNVQVSEVTDDCVIGVYVNGKLAGTSTFRVRSLPTPSGTIGGYRSGENVSASSMQSQNGIGVYVKDFPLDVQYEVLGYTLTIATDKGDVKTVDCQGAFFSPLAKDYINQYAKSGSTITVDKIRVKDQGGREGKIPSLVYFLK